MEGLLSTGPTPSSFRLCFFFFCIMYKKIEINVVVISALFVKKFSKFLYNAFFNL